MQQDYDPALEPAWWVRSREVKAVADVPALGPIIGDAVDFLYDNFNLPPRQLRAAYVRHCEERLRR